MKHTIRLDGNTVKNSYTEKSNDNETEYKTQIVDPGIQPINQSTELGDALTELNEDQLDSLTRMSGIDMRSILHPMELPNIVALDSLVALQILHSRTLAFTRQKKRLSVSIQGKGREQIVEIVHGKREQDRSGGALDKLQKILGPQ